jgi:hypothetical protein
MPVPGKSCQSRFASLKGKGDFIFVINIFKYIIDYFVSHILRHNPIRWGFPDSADIGIKTVTASHIAERRCRLDQQAKVLH